MIRTEVNRRDLIQCLAAGVPAAAAAEFCGFDYKPGPAGAAPPERRRQRRAGRAKTSSDGRAVVKEIRLHAAVRARIRPGGFEGEPLETDSVDRPPPFSEQELRVREYPPEIAPLMPLTRLWPYLHRVIGWPRPGRRLDIPRTVRLAATARPMPQLPRRRIQRWAPRIRIVVDESLPVGFLDDDVEILLREITRLRGRHGLLVSRVDADALPDLEALPLPTLVLSDLGQLRRDGAIVDEWIAFAKRLMSVGAIPTALVPCPRDRWLPSAAAVWRCACWDRHAQPPPSGKGLEAVVDPGIEEKRRRRADNLLTLLAPALLVEPQLLRALRCLLPPDKADIGSEYDARVGQATAVAGRDMALAPQAAPVYANRFEHSLDPELRDAAAMFLMGHHGGFGPAPRGREILNLVELKASVPGDVVESARTIQERINETMQRDLTAVEIARGLGLFQWRAWEIPRLTPRARAAEHVARGWVLATRFYGMDQQEILQGMNRDHIREAMRLVLADPGKVSRWIILQKAGAIELKPWAP
ncbi:MAG: hypothetical protein GY859_21170, partial [Desulfobacterales bacterium]|nr:hypothetical protein [Desulfobacterales bacterium]